MTEHFQKILDGLQVGLEEDEAVELDLPYLLDGMPPPVAIRAIVTIDDSPYEVVIRPSQNQEAYPA